MNSNMTFTVRGNGVAVLCQSRQQAEDFITKMRMENPDKELTIVPSEETPSSKVESTPPASADKLPADGRPYTKRQRPVRRGRPVASGSNGKRGFGGGIRSGGKRKKKRKHGSKK